jgi:hypothetical protein
MTGQRFDRLVVDKYIRSDGPGFGAVWQCNCDCGNIWIGLGRRLRIGETKSCGCLDKERRIIHGMKYTPTYGSWSSMMTRCYNSNTDSYKNYGARGITVCRRWRVGKNNKSGFECFYEDMGKRPKNTTLGRKDNNVKYKPSNCEWQMSEPQANNRRNTIFIELNGRQTPLAIVARRLNMTYHKLYYRVIKCGITKFLAKRS